MSKRKRRNRGSVVLRAMTLPLCMGVAASLGIAAFSGPGRGFRPPVHKADRLAGLKVWTKPFQVASLNNDWMLHIVPAEIDGKRVLLAQADTNTAAPTADTVTTQSIAPAAAAKDNATALDKLALGAQLTKGRQAYMEAIKIDPMRADLQQQPGSVETDLGNLEAASEAFDRARSLKPSN